MTSTTAWRSIRPARRSTSATAANRFARFDGKTGAGGLLNKGNQAFFATDLAVGYDGLLYVQTGEGFSGPLERLTRDLAPAPYEAIGSHVLSKYIYGRYGIGNCEKGIGVGPDGKVFVAWMFGGWVKYAVSGWGPDGNPINGTGSDIDASNHKSGTPGVADQGDHRAYPAVQRRRPASTWRATSTSA